MLFVGPKFAEIVKVGETIKDWLKTRKITRVSASPISSGLFKKKEDVYVVSYEGKKTPRISSSYHGRSRPSQSSYQTCYTQAYYQNIPPPLQLPKCSSHLPKYSPSHIQKFPSISPNPILSLPKCRSQLHKRAFKLPSVSPSILRPSSSLQKYLPKIQNYMPNYQTNCYPRYQAPHPNVQNYCQVPPLQGNYTTPLVLDLRKSPPKFLLHFPKDEQSCTSD